MTHKCLNKQSLASIVDSCSQWYCSIAKSRAGRISNDLYEIQFLCSLLPNYKLIFLELSSPRNFVIKNAHFSILLPQRAFLVLYCICLFPSRVCRLFPGLQVLLSMMQTLFLYLFSFSIIFAWHVKIKKVIKIRLHYFQNKIQEQVNKIQFNKLQDTGTISIKRDYLFSFGISSKNIYYTNLSSCLVPAFWEYQTATDLRTGVVLNFEMSNR